ncbi:hypothetical protein TeGR_g5363 [Tetraparma gracilis]|uniref:ATP-dependent rRNA helicase SPB4-like C-terminal extension domain-containing protein n=1 Tax=Tetraparma gracilis TaxID=2962635 RepID=A0ABQ6N509_9STRA|nr:hypothetical protein TeGR_g5363 [Tetraparma gracilis]
MACCFARQANKIMEEGLVGLGKKAFVSFIRAYSAKEKAVRHIFSSRTLHLGHIARSFALRDSPTELKAGTSSSKNDDTPRVGKLAFKGGTTSTTTSTTIKTQEPVDKSTKKKRTAKGSFTPQLVEYKSAYAEGGVGAGGGGLKKNKKARIEREHKDKEDKEAGREMSVGDKRKLMMEKAHNLSGMNAF